MQLHFRLFALLIILGTEAISQPATVTVMTVNETTASLDSIVVQMAQIQTVVNITPNLSQDLSISYVESGSFLRSHSDTSQDS